MSSNEVRIQDFFREVDIDYFYVALLLLQFLPAKKKLRLCIDRTEWDFGSCQINILMIVVGCGDYQLPLYWELLDNRSGNSSTENRKDIVKLCVDLLGKDRIGYIVGDREFVGHSWFKYLKDNGISFVMRLPKHHSIQSQDGSIFKIESLNLPADKPLILKDCLVDGVVADVWIKKLSNGDFLYLLGTVNSDFIGQLYAKRWTVETCFQGLKGRGFDIEKTHLKCLKKVKKLIALVAIAYAICGSTGIYFHKKVQKIKKKKHGYKSNSFVRKGLNIIREQFRHAVLPSLAFEKKIFGFLRWLKIQMTHYQALNSP
jgi:transposase